MGASGERGILVAGGHACRNRGDWAIAGSALENLRRSGLDFPALLQMVIPLADVAIDEPHEPMTVWPTWRRSWHRFGSLGSMARYYRLQIADMRRHLRAAAARLKEKGARGKPLLWTIGGGIMNDTVAHGPFTVRMGRVAHEEGWEIVMTGETIGPIVTDRFRADFADFARRCTYLSVRDPESYEYIQGIDGLSCTPQRALDDVFYTEGVPPGFDDPERFRREAGCPPPSEPFVLMTVHRQGGNPVPLDFDAIFKAADAVRETGRSVVFVNFSGHEEAEDSVIGDWAQGRDRAAYIRERIRVRSIRELATSADLVVSTRFHGQVFALHAGVPVICPYSGTYYRSKSFRLQQEWGLESLAIDVAQGWGSLSDLCIEALSNLADLRSTIARHRPPEVGGLNPFVASRLARPRAVATPVARERVPHR